MTCINEYDRIDLINYWNKESHEEDDKGSIKNLLHVANGRTSQNGALEALYTLFIH